MTADSILQHLTDIQNHTQRLLQQLNVDAALAAPLVEAVTHLEQTINASVAPLQADSTAQKEQLLHYQQALFQAPIAICILHGPDLRYTFSNPIYNQIVGREDILGKPVREVVKISNEEIFHLLDQVYQTGESFTTREMLISFTRHGDAAAKDAYFDLNYLPLRDHENTIIGIVAYLIDVSDRHALEVECSQVLDLTRKAHVAADAERQRLLRVLHESPSAICIIEGPEHLLSFTNPAFDRLVGQREFSKIPARKIFPEIEFQGFFELLDQVYATGVPYIGNEMSVLFDRDGTGKLTQTFLNFIFAPLRDTFDQIYGIFVQAIDITELVATRQEARAAVVARDQFLSIAAHELRTPLTSLLGYSQVIQRRLRKQESLDPRTAQALRTMETQSKRLSRLINTLLDITRVNTDRLLLSCEPLEVNNLVQQVLDEVSITIEHREIKLQRTQEPCYIHGDSLRLEQVMINLIQNALKYSDQTTPVEVSIEQEATSIRLIVRDYGIGIPITDIPHIFERFYRVNNHSTNSVSGMGIGLSVVQEIVTLHGGTINVQSTQGQGSTFTVQLPRIATPPNS